MASTMSSSSTFLSSPRGQRMLLWISGAVLVIGIGIFLGVFFSRGTAQAAPSDASTLPSQPTETNPGQTGTTRALHVKPSSSAVQVARTFLETAVARKNLDVAYNLVGPALKAGIPRAQWLKGNNPVTYYPAKNLKTPDIQVQSSTKNALLLEVGLVSAPGTQIYKTVKSLAFKLEVDRIHGRWLVNYFLPDYHPGKLQSPTN